MAINDILHGLLALGSGAGKAYAVKKQRELDQRDEFQRAMIAMENQVRLQARDKEQFERWSAQSGNDALRTEIAGLRAQIAGDLAGFKMGPEFDMRVKNLESLASDRAADNARIAAIEAGRDADRDDMRELRRMMFLRLFGSEDGPPTEAGPQGAKIGPDGKVITGGAGADAGMSLTDKRVIQFLTSTGNEMSVNQAALLLSKNIERSPGFSDKVLQAFAAKYPKKANLPLGALMHDKDFIKLVQDADLDLTDHLNSVGTGGQ